MCGRYYVDDSVCPAVERLFRQSAGGMTDDGLSSGIDRQKWPAGDVRPTDTAPVITAAGNEIRLHFLRWGYPGVRNGQTIFNARAESVLEKRIFQNGVQQHRAAVPCARFYEWNRNKEKAEFFREDSPAIFMAGFYDIFADGERYMILTTEANASMKETHDRMPLILEEDEVRGWILDGSRTESILTSVPVLLGKRTAYEQMSLFPSE